MTGIRVHPGGTLALHGVRPDLTTLGKVIGGGLPVGAYGRRLDKPLSGTAARKRQSRSR